MRSAIVSDFCQRTHPFFGSATGTMGILLTSFRVSVSRGPMNVWAQQASCGGLLGVASGEDSRSLAQHCRGQGTSRSYSHLFSLHLATPLSVPGSYGLKPCAPLVGPFSSGTLFGPGVTEGFKKGGISSLSLANIGKNFCLSQFAK